MVTLDQIRLLDSKVKSAVEHISLLKKENGTLKERLEEYQNRIEELEVLIETFKQDQGQIEEGILQALDQLDQIEDSASASDLQEDEEAVTADLPEDTQDTEPSESEFTAEEEILPEESAQDEQDEPSYEAEESSSEPEDQETDSADSYSPATTESAASLFSETDDEMEIEEKAEEANLTPELGIF